MKATICYYVTGHGFGHATRVISVVRWLLEQGYKVHIVSALDPNLFFSNLIRSGDEYESNLAKSLTCYRRVLDAGAVQLDPLHVDIAQTLGNYYNSIHIHRESLVNAEKQFLIECGAKLVLVDVTPLGCAAAEAANIPSMLVTNFTWDVAYQFLYNVIQSTLNITDQNNYIDMIRQCNEDVCSADYYLRLPGITPLPNNYTGTVIPGPLVCRNVKTSRIEVRKSLNIAEDVNVLVLGFGGFKMSDAWAINDSMLPPNWVCVVLGSEGDQMVSPRFIPLAKSAYVPDIIGAADAVLGKLGYGTVSECLTTGTPLLYVPRADWPEEEYLSSFIMKYNAGIRLSEQDFLAGKWEKPLQDALEKKNKWDVSDLNVGGALIEIECIISRIINN